MPSTWVFGRLGGPGMCHIRRILSYVSYTYAMPILRRGIFDVSEQNRTEQNGIDSLLLVERAVLDTLIF